MIGLVAGALVARWRRRRVGAPCDAETRYHCARVERDPQRASGRMLVLENLRHSYVDLRDPRRLEFDYVRWIGDAIDGVAPRGAALDGVFLGGAGFTLPRYLLATRPGSRARVLEVDRELVDVARERLGLTHRPRPSRRDRRRARDARGRAHRVRRCAGRRRVQRPRRCRGTSRRSSSRARSVACCGRGGVYALNVIDQPPLRLARAEAATLLEVFGDVALVARRGARGGPAGGNLVLLAAPARLPAGVRRRPAAPAATTARRPTRFAAGAAPLRDLDAPADQLVSRP